MWILSSHRTVIVQELAARRPGEEAYFRDLRVFSLLLSKDVALQVFAGLGFRENLPDSTTNLCDIRPSILVHLTKPL